MKINDVFTSLVTKEQKQEQDLKAQQKGLRSHEKDSIVQAEDPYDLDIDAFANKAPLMQPPSHSCTCNATCEGCRQTDNCGHSHYCPTQNRCGHSDNCGR